MSEAEQVPERRLSVLNRQIVQERFELGYSVDADVAWALNTIDGIASEVAALPHTGSCPYIFDGENCDCIVGTVLAIIREKQL